MTRHPILARLAHVAVSAALATLAVGCGTPAQPEADASTPDVADTEATDTEGAGDVPETGPERDAEPADDTGTAEDSESETDTTDAVADTTEADAAGDTAEADSTVDVADTHSDPVDTQDDSDATPSDTGDAAADASACGPAPVTGCNDDTGCDEGFVCEPSVLGVCLPSACACDPGTGDWFCTADCSLGTCVVDEYPACDRDDDCPAGEQWCEDDVCTECDNGGLVCRIACLEGYVLAERNGCHPCECVPANECEQDADCLAWQRCDAGAECLSWCEAGDPSCCYGNRCVDLPD